MKGFLFAATAACFAFAPASATTYVRDVTISPSLIGGAWSGQVDIDQPFTYQDGDVVDLTIHFTPSPSFQPVDPSRYQFRVSLIGGVDGNRYFAQGAIDATFELFNPTSNLNASGGLADPASTLGSALFAITKDKSTQLTQFDGARLVYQITGGSPLNSEINRVNIGFDDITAIPEPTTWAMMLLGFGAIGAATRAGRRARPDLQPSTQR